MGKAVTQVFESFVVFSHLREGPIEYRVTERIGEVEAKDSRRTLWDKRTCKYKSPTVVSSSALSGEYSKASRYVSMAAGRLPYRENNERRKASN